MNIIFYVTLVECLSGYCLRFSAPNEDIVREYCAKYLGRVWFTVYTEDHKPPERLIGETIYLEGVR